MSRAPSRTASRPRRPGPVSRPHDPAERQADRAADVVARGGSVRGWSFSGVSTSAVHREETGSGDSQQKKYTQAGVTLAKAALETDAGKALRATVLDDPVVRTVKQAVTSPPGIAVGLGLAAGGVAALGVASRPLPVQPPAIPLDRLTPGLSAQVTYEGPVDAPTTVGLTLTYREQGPAAKPGGPSEKDRFRAETARLGADQAAFRAGLRHPAGSEQARQQQAEQAAVARLVAQTSSLPGVGRPLIPLTGGPVTITPPAPSPEQPQKTDETPVQREPASATHDPPTSQARVPDALRGSGRPLDPSVRAGMEARFGYDFSSVRLHDDGAAHAAAHDLRASAFTVGTDIAFAPGRYDPSGAAGRHLLAHELAHVVQQRRGASGGEHGGVLHRRGVAESIGILLGLEEGTWSDAELTAYLTQITRTGRIDGSYDADNKARAVVRRWVAGTPGFDLLAPQKVLLVREMLDGPTLAEDEACILDLLERSDAGDLRAVLGPGGVGIADLESDIDGDNRTRLDTFVNGRFRGGADALRRGTVEPTGPAVPAGAPSFAFDPAALDARFDGERSAEELVALVERFSPADRQRALHHLSQVRRPRQLAERERLIAELRAATTDEERRRIQARGASLRDARLRTERVLLHFFRDAVPATAADLTSGTAPSDPARAAELRAALRPPVRTAPGGGSAFVDTLPGEAQSYEAKMRDLLPRVVEAHDTSLVAGRGPAEHADPARVHSLAEFEAIGNVSKAETDAVFGRFATQPPLRADRPGRRGTIHDRFADMQRDLSRMTRGQRRDNAKALVLYFFQSEDEVRRINAAHDAAPEFDRSDRPTNPEAQAIDRVATVYVATPAHVTRLNEIDRNWPATALRGEVSVQLFRADTAAKERLLAWDAFQTLVHEYIHTLEHDDYHRYARTFGDSSNAYNTLVEGVCSLLTEVVWENVAPRVTDTALRTGIEGAANAALPPVDVPHASQQRYPSFTEALRLADLVGAPAVYAAFYLGLTDRIGGPAPRGRARP